MSRPGTEPPARDAGGGGVALAIRPRDRDLDGLTVRRVLPARHCRSVGPFVFFDHMGPASFPPGGGIQVRPHPHIGLATVTYLFAGEIVHRDSLGVVQTIRPGAVNLMTAGSGIVHSERAGEDPAAARLHGIQTWMALPEALQECDPAFAHYPAAALEERDLDGVRVRVIMGEAFGLSSPVVQHSPTLYAELRLPAGGGVTLPRSHRELAAYVVTGEVAAGEVGAAGTHGAAATMLVVAPGAPLRLVASADSRVMLIGGTPLGRRRMWWNFVSTSSARIERAKADWHAGRFPPVPGDDERAPLPAG
jgi:redox-sensitive bicupin YhaK (pirin superfamily)